MAMTRGVLVGVLVPVLREADAKMGVKCARISLHEREMGS